MKIFKIVALLLAAATGLGLVAVLVYVIYVARPWMRNNASSEVFVPATTPPRRLAG